MQKVNRSLTLTDFALVYFLLCFLYRIFLSLEGYWANSLVGIPNVAVVSLGLFDDFLLACLIFMPAYGLSRFKIIRNIYIFSMLLLTAIAYAANKKLFLTLSIHLSVSSIKNAWQSGFTFPYFFSFLNISDGVLVLFPLIFLIFLGYISEKKVENFFYGGVLPVFFSLIMISFSFFISYDLAFNRVRKVIFYSNPINYLIRDVYFSLNNPYLHENKKNQPSESQMNSIGFIDPIFTLRKKNLLTQNTSPSKEWNVVLVILESVGFPYIFDTHYNAQMPMPFLHSLSKQGWWLTHYYSSGNNSPIGAFGLFSGIYPVPLPTHAMMRADLMIPNIATWLPPHYDSFFVSSGDTHLYFPRHFIMNTGFKKFYDATNLPPAFRKARSNLYVDDLSALAFFLSRIAQSKSPFFGVYWPCATHYPYLEYALAKKPYPNITPDFSRYLNNLTVMDYQLAQIYTTLKNKKLLDKTIFIIVGDHGEGFGQHTQEGSYMHGGASFEEQIHVPALFYQPALFPPKEIRQVTSAVDLLPTLLAAMKRKYPINYFQGESLLAPMQYRKYIFVYGENNELVAINRKYLKTQLSFEQTYCKAYDLSRDPNEKVPLKCQQEIKNAILQFHYYQPAIFEKYNYFLRKHPEPLHDKTYLF